jgi:hypothetical protein
MAAQWYYAQDEQKHGPVSDVQLKELAASGKLAPTDLVWNEQFTERVAACQIAWLTFQPQVPVPPPVLPPALPENAHQDAGTAGGHDALGLGKYLRAPFLQSISKPLVAFGLTIAILFALLLTNSTMGYAFIFASAFVIYFDASDNRIGYVPPRTFDEQFGGNVGNRRPFLLGVVPPVVFHQTSEAH